MVDLERLFLTRKILRFAVHSMPKCLSCGCEIDESNEASDALYKDGYCYACSLAEEHQSKEDAVLYDTYISTLYTQDNDVESQEKSNGIALPAQEEETNEDVESEHE